MIRDSCYKTENPMLSKHPCHQSSPSPSFLFYSGTQVSLLSPLSVHRLSLPFHHHGFCCRRHALLRFSFPILLPFLRLPPSRPRLPRCCHPFCAHAPLSRSFATHQCRSSNSILSLLLYWSGHFVSWGLLTSLKILHSMWSSPFPLFLIMQLLVADVLCL